MQCLVEVLGPEQKRQFFEEENKKLVEHWSEKSKSLRVDWTGYRKRIWPLSEL